MFVAEILKTKGNAVFSIAPDRTVAEACAELESRRVGALVVCDGDRVAGVFSERDVVRVTLSGSAPLPAMKGRLTEAARKELGGVEVADQMGLARGAPPRCRCRTVRLGWRGSAAGSITGAAAKVAAGSTRSCSGRRSYGASRRLTSV